MPYSLLTKPCFIETPSFYAGTSEEVRLRGQIYAGTSTRGHIFASWTKNCSYRRFFSRFSGGFCEFSTKIRRHPAQFVNFNSPGKSRRAISIHIFRRKKKIRQIWKEEKKMNIPLFRGAGCNKVAKLCLGRRLDNIFTSTSSPTDYCTGSNNALTCTTGTVYNGVYHYVTHTHTWGVFSEPVCSTTKRVPMPNDTSPEISRQD